MFPFSSVDSLAKRWPAAAGGGPTSRPQRRDPAHYGRVVLREARSDPSTAPRNVAWQMQIITRRSSETRSGSAPTRRSSDVCQKGRPPDKLSPRLFALFGWTRTVAVWHDAYARGLARQAGEREAETVEALDRAARAADANHAVSVACKKRALCAWSLAWAAGLHATIVVGVYPFPIARYCWCEVGAQTLGVDRDRCDRFTPVTRWWDRRRRIAIPEALVEQAPVDDLGFLDKASLVDCLQRTGKCRRCGVPVVIERTLLLLVWLTIQRGAGGKRVDATRVPAAP